MKNVYTEGTSAATPTSLCVSTDNDEWPVIYSLATSKCEAKRLIELAIEAGGWDMLECSAEYMGGGMSHPPAPWDMF
jgi:hypothetical protein